MPPYDYKCEKCEHEFREYTKIANRNDVLELPCPECEEEGNIRRVYGMGNYVDSSVLQGDKNMERSGVLKELERIKHHHPKMVWKG